MQIPEYQGEFPMLGVLSNSHFYIISTLYPVLIYICLLIHYYLSGAYKGFLRRPNCHSG